MKRKTTIRYLAILVIVMAISACSYNKSMVKTAFDTMTISKAAYETSMVTLANLSGRGLLSDKDRGKAFEIADIYSKAHNAAVEALAKYAESGELTDRELYIKQIEMVNTALIDLLEIAKPYLEGK